MGLVWERALNDSELRREQSRVRNRNSPYQGGVVDVLPHHHGKSPNFEQTQEHLLVQQKGSEVYYSASLAWTVLGIVGFPFISRERNRGSNLRYSLASC